MPSTKIWFFQSKTKERKKNETKNNEEQKTSFCNCLLTAPIFTKFFDNQKTTKKKKKKNACIYVSKFLITFQAVLMLLI